MERKAYTLQEAFERQDKKIEALIGSLRALTKGVLLLIETHPEPKTALATWQANLPAQIDADMELEFFQSEAYRNSFQETMALLSHRLEKKADAG